MGKANPGLLTIRGDRIELEPTRDIVLGRALSCDIVVEDVGCSRRHATVRVSKRRRSCSIVDLDSRNGTFVDERRIAGRTKLEHGSRLRIGSTVFLFAVGDKPREEVEEYDLHDTGTVAFGPGGTTESGVGGLARSLGHLGSEFAGQLGQRTLIDLLQVLSQTHSSGTLYFETENGAAAVHLRMGEVLDAWFGEDEGFEALARLAHEPTGLFWFETDDIERERTIEIPISNLLLALCHTIDESAR